MGVSEFGKKDAQVSVFIDWVSVLEPTKRVTGIIQKYLE